MKPSEEVQRKFEQVTPASEWEVLSHDGWRDVESSNKTVPYELHDVTLENGMTLTCADTHILITEQMEEVYAKDSVGCEVNTINGPSKVISVESKEEYDNMYDLSVSGDNLYYTDGILSHNSQTVALFVLHQVMFFPDESAGITSYKLKNVKDIMKRIKYTYENLPFWMKPAVKEYNQFSISFTNDSQIVSEVTNESTFRGETHTIIFSDELAHVKPIVAEEFWTGILPSIEAAGNESTTKMIIISTPAGTAGKFAEIWFQAKNKRANGFKPIEVDPYEIPGRDLDYKKKMLRKMNKNKYLQEYECVFLSDKGTLINSSVLESLESKDPITDEIDDLDLFEKDLTNHKILIACDVSEGVGQDFHAAQIIDVDNFEQVGEFKNNTMTQTEYTKAIISMIKLCWELGAKEVYYTVENNSIGMGILTLLSNTEEDDLENATLISHADFKKPGMPTTASTKPHGCALLRDFVEHGHLTLNSENLISELKFFVKSGNSFKAEAGMNDDLCMAMVVACLAFEQLGDYEEDVYERVNGVNYDEDNDAYEVGIFL